MGLFSSTSKTAGKNKKNTKKKSPLEVPKTAQDSIPYMGVSNCLQTDGQTSLTAVSRPSMKTCKMKVYSWNVCSRLLIYIQPYRLSGFIEWKK